MYISFIYVKPWPERPVYLLCYGLYVIHIHIYIHTYICLYVYSYITLYLWAWANMQSILDHINRYWTMAITDNGTSLARLSLIIIINARTHTRTDGHTNTPTCQRPHLGELNFLCCNTPNSDDPENTNDIAIHMHINDVQTYKPYTYIHTFIEHIRYV